MPFRFLILLLVGIGLAACEDPPPDPRQKLNYREAKPPKGSGITGDFCMVIRNRAPFSITGRVTLKTRERGSFRLSRNKSTRICLSGTLYGENTVSLVLTNFVTVPIFSCYTRPDQAIDIFAYKKGEGWLYNATCHR